MSIAEFFQSHIDTVREIITDLNQQFTSHDFIQKFAKRFETEYVEYLYEYRTQEPFRIVHGQIAKFLGEHEHTLNLRRTQRVRSTNVFGEITDAQQWERVS